MGDPLVRLHAGAFNGHDIETLVGHYPRTARLIRDGTWIGEGPDVMRRGLEAEYRGRDVVGRVAEVDGKDCLIEFDGADGRTPTGVVRFDSDGTRVTEIRIEHDPDLVRELVRRAAQRTP